MPNLKKSIMNKKVIFSLVAVGFLALTSCKKDFTCECTTSSMGISNTVQTTINDTKSNAEESCESGSGTVTNMGVEATTTCKIVD